MGKVMGLSGRISRLELQAELIRAFQPFVEHHGIQCHDNVYWIPTPEDVDVFHERVDVKRKQYIPEIGDCDDFAVVTHGRVREMRWNLAAAKKIPAAELYPWTYGWCVGVRFRGEIVGHSLNVILQRDGRMWIYEPQNGDMWVVGSRGVDWPTDGVV
jgi:hypothetical protein